MVVPKYRKTVPNIQDFWIKLVPNDDQFISVILKTFSEGLQQIKCFERWSKHADLLLYSEALETWDDKVGEDFGESSLESTSLDPVSWISEHPIQKNREQEVKDVIKSAYAKAKQFMTRFQPILEIYWRNLQFDINVLVDVNLVNAVESLQNTLNLLKYYQAYFQSNLPSNCDIGLLHLDSLKIKNELQPKPRQLQDDVERLVPEVTKQRTILVLEWLTQSIRDMARNVADVSDFVLKKKDFDRISEAFQPKRDQIDLYGQFFGVLANIGYKIRKEDENHLKDAEKQISNLAARLAEVEQKMDAEMETHKKNLDKLIPELNVAVHELTEECQQPQYLDKNSDMTEMIKLLDEKWEKFEEYRDTAAKYNGWQEEMRWQPTIFANIEELKEQLEARRTLWRSLHEWKELKDAYEKMLWNDINDDDIKRNAEAYNKTANRLIRALPPNPIVDELKFLVD